MFAYNRVFFRFRSVLRRRANRFLRWSFLQRDSGLVSALLFLVVHFEAAVDQLQQHLEHWSLCGSEPEFQRLVFIYSDETLRVPRQVTAWLIVKRLMKDAYVGLFSMLKLFLIRNKVLSKHIIITNIGLCTPSEIYRGLYHESRTYTLCERAS